MDRVTVRAPAKVNLHLAVGERLPDGYHSVETVLQSIDLYDRVEVVLADSLSVACEPDLGVDPTENLGHMAATALARRFGRPPHVAISITKAIPAGAGLGGGSSDAAAVLAGCAVLWGISIEDPLLSSVASELGADVPFFLSGGAAIFVGRGDEFVRALPSAEVYLAIVKPSQPVSTAAAYKTFDRLAHGPVPGVSDLESALDSGDPARLARTLFNNMTESSVQLVSAISDVLLFCGEQTGVHGALMAGSGSAVFAICDSEATSYRVRDAAQARGWWATSARTIDSGVAVSQHGEST